MYLALGRVSYKFSTHTTFSKPRPLLTEIITFSGRAWYYQTCTEYGYYQTAPNTGTVFDHLNWLNVEFYVDMCKRAFDER